MACARARCRTTCPTPRFDSSRCLWRSKTDRQRDSSAEVVFGTKNYLRAMRGATPDERIIYLYACQVVREPNGVWCALADRTQGPSGGGLAVENRLAISRVLESDFRSMNVMRLASFFAGLREQLNAPEYLKTPKSARNVLLSPGVASPTFFEDAYLARYLGYTLTQTSDLTVRGGDVYLKTLGGLVSVDSILRRIPDIDCDPLELNTQSSSESRASAKRFATNKFESPINSAAAGRNPLP